MTRGIQRQAEVYHWRTSPYHAYHSWQRIAAFAIPPEWEGENMLLPPDAWMAHGGTGEDWSRHVQGLDTLLNDMYHQGVDSRSMFGNTRDAITGETTYTPERQARHQEIINHFMEKMKAVPREHRAILMAGLGGAGKTYAQSQPWFGKDTAKNFFTLSADDVKEVMAEKGMMPTAKDDPRFAGYSPMELSSLIHMESDHIAKQLANAATGQGTNVIWDYRMANLPSAQQRIKQLQDAGYGDIGAFLVNVDSDRALRAAVGRHKDGMTDYYRGASKGGRWLPSYAHGEGKPVDPAKMSSSQEAFEQLTTQYPHLLTMGWGQVDNRDRERGTISMGGSGRWGHLNKVIGRSLSDEFGLPPGPGHVRPTTPSAAPAPAGMVTARRYFMANDDFNQPTDPASIRGLLDAYRDGQIDYPGLLEGVSERFAQVGPADQRHPERADWSEYMHSEMMPDDDDWFWVTVAVGTGLIDARQKDEMVTAAHQGASMYGPPSQEAPFGY